MISETDTKSVIPIHVLVTLAIGVLAGVLLSLGGLSEVVERWNKQEEYSHGFLIPLVSLYIIWEKRFAIAADYRSGSWWAAPVVIVSLLIIFIGEISALYLLVQYSFLILLAGLSIAALGRAAKHTLIPIAIMAFAIPLPYFLEAVLTARLQLISSEIGVDMIRLMGIPVFLSGNVIDLGDYKLQVVEACSGLSYLFPLACLAFIAAYFYKAALWKRAILFLSSVPITILMNSFRIAVTGWLVDRWGTAMAEGFLHDFEGWIIFMACAVILVLEMLLLEWLTTGRKLHQVFGMDVAVSTRQKVSAQSGWPLALWSVVGVIFIGAFAVQAFDKRIEDVPQNISLTGFPERLGDWQGTHGSISTWAAQALKLTDYLMINYHRSDEPMVNFYVAYYASQRKGASPHSPRVCIPGGGWEIAEIKRIEVGDIPLNRVIIRRGFESQLVYYWFQERGEPIANEYLKKWKLLEDAVKLNRTDGALVRVTTPVLQTESVAVAEKRLHDLMAAVYPQLLEVLPAKGEL